MTHRPLAGFSGLMVATALVSVAGLVFDDRTMAGEPIWLKPFKFSVSLLVYALTWTWLLSLQRRPRRVMWWAGTASAVLLGVEMVIIVGQVVRGRASHFNAETAFDTALFTIMGIAITAVWVLGMVQGLILLRKRIPDRPLALAIRFGVVLGSVGIGLAFLMTGPTPDQLAALDHGLSPDRLGAHSVGVPDGGPGLPITGWSTTGGDLRIPHFVGIHALQALPLLAFLLARTTMSADVRARLVIVGGIAYAGLTGLVTWQALRGQPLLSLDLWTAAAFGVLVAGTAGGVLSARRTAMVAV
jgi:hypothetical protein